MNSIQYMFDAIQDNINNMTPQELMLRPALLDLCNRYKIEKEWK